MKRSRLDPSKGGPALEKHALTVTVENVDDVPVIRAVGELEIATVPEMRAKVMEVTERRPRAILFDFLRLSYLDSSGLGILVSARKRLAVHEGEVVIITTQTAVLKALSLSGLDQIMRIYASEEEYFGNVMMVR
jgi:anti-anti-sigma factor